MAYQPANHYEVAGDGIDATVDLSSLIGEPTASVVLDREPLDNPAVTEGEVLRPAVALVPVQRQGLRQANL